jgi:hypothetical protein
MEQLQTNKWVGVLLGVLTAGLAALAGTKWTDLVNPQTAAFIVAGIGFVQTVLASIAPSPGKPVAPVRKGGLKGLIFSHRTTNKVGEP